MLHIRLKVKLTTDTSRQPVPKCLLLVLPIEIWIVKIKQKSETIPNRDKVRIFMLWCGRQDLNLHFSRKQNLNLSCMPISPRPHIQLLFFLYQFPIRNNCRNIRKRRRKKVNTYNSKPNQQFLRRAVYKQIANTTKQRY